jgi:hypothetical protein
MRLTSAMWFAVFMRQESARGAYVSVVKTGAQQAGALFIIHNHLDGTQSLYSPAPQALLDDPEGDDRKFECALDTASQEDIDAYLEKQKNFDPDLWIIETESGSGEISLAIAKS